MIKFLPIGGADEIGANSYYLNIFGTGIILDCGIHPRKVGADSLPDFSLIEDSPVDFVLISHAHQDHIGSLPYLIKKFPHAVIYSTWQTKEIAELTLHNSVKIMKDRMSGTDELAPYTHDEIDLLVQSIRPYDYNETFFLRGLRHEIDDEIKVTFYDAGHILGSAGILLGHNDQKIYYTGDINLSEQEIMNGAILPDGKIDVLITESTYAGMASQTHRTWATETKRLASSINKIVSNGGSVLIPVFALGKTQEILMTIYNMIRAGLIADTPLFAGGISKKISRRYDHNRYKVKRNYVDTELSDIPFTDLFETDVLTEMRKKSVIALASSGMMLERTMSFDLAREWIRYKQNAIFIVGYMDPETPGYRIENAKHGDEIILNENLTPVKANCTIKRFNFPSHTRSEELLEITERLLPGRVIIVHGDNKSIDRLGMNILSEYPSSKVHAAKVGKWIIF